MSGLDLELAKGASMLCTKDGLQLYSEFMVWRLAMLVTINRNHRLGIYDKEELLVAMYILQNIIDELAGMKDKIALYLDPWEPE